MSLALSLDLTDQHGRGDGADGNAARLRAADAVEYFLLVAGCHDAVQCCLGRSYDADAAHQFVWPAVHVNAVDHERDDLERLRGPPRGDRKPGGDVLEVEPVGLALLLRLGDQHGAKLRVRHRLGRGDDEIALASSRHVAGFGAAMAVALSDAGDGKARHQEGLEDAILDEVDAASGLAFVVEVVVAA